MRHPARPVGHDAARPAALEELETEAALPDARVGHHPDDLAVALERAGERGLERRRLIGAPDEAGEPSHAREVEPRAERARALLAGMSGLTPKLAPSRELGPLAMVLVIAGGALRRKGRVT